MERWGVLNGAWRPRGAGVCRWYVIQRCPTFWSERDRWLVEHQALAFVKTICPPTWGVGPWWLDVPPIKVFSYKQASLKSQ